MADTGIFCTREEALRKAGANVATISETGTNDFILQAESTINAACRYNYSATYLTLSSSVREILKSAASSLAAIECVAYDTSNYTSRIDAENIIAVQRDSAQRNIALLRDKKTQQFINDA